MPIYRRIAITGAAGALGRQLRIGSAKLADEVVLTDVAPAGETESHELFRQANLTDFKEVCAMVAGCEAVVHLGAKALEGSFGEILDSNIVGTYNIYEAARKSGVQRIVYASSIHAIGFHERTTTVDASMPTRPDSLYGLSKVFGENLARYYFDKFGIESVCIRIGSCFPEPTDRRHLSTWLSYDDFRQIVFLALQAERVGCMIAMPTSRNATSFWDDRHAASLGFTPRNSADDFAAEILRNTPRGEPRDPAIRYQGGSFCAAGHFEDPK
jgi:uronate dehydrogenase